MTFIDHISKFSKPAELTAVEYREVSAEIWNFFMEHINAEGSDEWWKKTVSAADRLYDRYKNTPIEAYVREYILCCMNEISRRVKDKDEKKVKCFQSSTK